MNKFERQSRHPADQETLSEAIAGELSELAAEVLDIGDAPPIAPRAPLTPGEVRTILMSLMLTMFLAALDQTIVATALPTIGRQFQDVSSLSWVITAYLLASTAVAPVFGTLSDIYGRRAMIIAALSLFVAGSILCALAPNMPVLILARGLQGLGGGGIMPIVQTVISDVVTPRERGQYQAYFSGVWVVAGIGGPDRRRRVRRASALVDDLLDQRAARAGIAGAAAAEDGQDPGVSPQAQGRLARRRAADGLRGRLHAGADLGRQPLSLAVADDHGDGRRVDRAGARLRLACRKCRRAVPAAAADGRNGGALRDGRRRLRDGRDAGADRASAALLRGGLSSQRQRGGACADSAGRDFDRRRCDRRPDHGARQALQAGGDHRERRLRRWRVVRSR